MTLRRERPAVAARIACVALIVAAAPAFADDRITDDTPYTTPAGFVRAGLWKPDYGVHGVPGLEVGTYTLPYLTLALGVTSGNGHVKYRFLDRGRWTLATSLGVSVVDFSGIGADATVTIVPMQLLAAVRLGRRFAVGFGMMYSQVYGEAAYNEDEATELRGAVAVSNAQTWFSLMWKWTRGLTLYLESRGVSSVEGAAAGDVTHQIDERTTVGVTATGNASIDELQGSSFTVALHWARQRFRLRVGIGYGNYNLPMLNFVTPVAIPYPEFDVYWVF